MNDKAHHAHRVIFIDLARAAAVIMMLYGHTVSALLAVEYRVGLWHDVWVFQRGLTSGLFLLLSGFAFSIATTRHWPAHTHLSAQVLRRLRRFGLYILLGYGLHFPVSSLAELRATTGERWLSFLAVDVLQLIGVTFVAVQLLVLATRERRVFAAAAFVLAAVVLLVSPWAWTVDWPALVPLPVAAYLTPATGSLFPLFPWAAYVLIGAGLGQLYARWGADHLASFASRVLFAPGVALLAVVLTTEAAGLPLFGSGPMSWVPADVLIRTGACLIVLAVIAHSSRFIARLPRVFGVVAQESLLIYFVHLCILYGSIWSPGLQRLYGEALAPAATVLVVVVLMAAMVGLAWMWNGLKHARPRLARRISVAVGACLVLLLLV